MFTWCDTEHASLQYNQRLKQYYAFQLAGPVQLDPQTLRHITLLPDQRSVFERLLTDCRNTRHRSLVAHAPRSRRGILAVAASHNQLHQDTLLRVVSGVCTTLRKSEQKHIL